MEPYRNALRITILTRRGIADVRRLEAPSTLRKLDESIIKVAGKYLPKSQLGVFFLAYSCEETWKTISDKYNSSFDKELGPATLRRYAGNAVLRIIEIATSDPELAKRIEPYDEPKERK